jgi:hypothetical protein
VLWDHDVDGRCAARNRCRSLCEVEAQLGRGRIVISSGSGGEQADPVDPDRERWEQDFRDFVHGRMARVQSAAQQWLVTITALLGLFSAAVVVGGGGSGIGKLPGAWPGVVVGLAAVVYGVAFRAVWEGALATFRGLGVRLPNEDETRYAAEAEKLRDWKETDRNELDRALNRARALAKLSTQGSKWKTFADMWSPPPLVGGVSAYRDRYELQTNSLRRHLHRSRVLGVLAAILSGALAWLVLLLNVVYPSG